MPPNHGSLGTILHISYFCILGVAVSITTSANWIGNFIVAMVTPILLGNPVLGTAGTFYIISVFLFLAFVFVLLTLPETKGESLERIDQLFSKPWLQRIDLFYYLRFIYTTYMCIGRASVRSTECRRFESQLRQLSFSFFHCLRCLSFFLSFFLSTSPITSCISLGLVSLVVSLPRPSPNALCQVSLFIQAYEMFHSDPAS